MSASTTRTYLSTVEITWCSTLTTCQTSWSRAWEWHPLLITPASWWTSCRRKKAMILSRILQPLIVSFRVRLVTSLAIDIWQNSSVHMLLEFGALLWCISEFLAMAFVVMLAVSMLHFGVAIVVWMSSLTVVPCLWIWQVSDWWP